MWKQCDWNVGDMINFVINVSTMNATELKELRKKTKKLIDHAGERMLRMVHDLLKAEVENEKDDFHLTPEQEAELDEIMELDKKGLMEYSSWEEVKVHILSKKRK